MRNSTDFYPGAATKFCKTATPPLTLGAPSPVPAQSLLLLEWSEMTPAALQALLDQGAAVDERDPDSRTPLYRAARSANPAVVALLLDRGADSNARVTGSFDKTPLHLAALFNENPVVVALLPFEQLGAFVNESMLQDVAPMVLRFNDQQSVGALVQSFYWKPAFQERGDGSVPALDWGMSFFENAGAFVALLALFHAAPIRGLVTIPY